MAKQATATTTENQPSEQPKTAAELADAQRAATIREEWEKLGPGEFDVTGLWMDIGKLFPNGQRSAILGGMWSGSSLSGRVLRIVMMPSGTVRMHVDVTSGRLPVGSRNYVFFGPGAYSYVEAMPITPKELGIAGVVR